MAIEPIVALEIGTSKVIVLVGEMREHGNIMITGMGKHESHGVRKGEIVDFENAGLGVRAAITQAEETSKVSIGQVHLVVSGGHVQSTSNRGTVAVQSPDRVISDDDLDQVMDVAGAVHLSPDRDVLHTICQHFCIDGQEMVIRPEGMEGAQLSLDMLLIHGLRSRFQNAIRVVGSVPLEVDDVAFGGLCSALSVLTVEQKKSGVIVIDLGAGTTDYLVYANNIVATGGALGVGGDHITNDIGLAFNIPRLQAESLKCKHGSAVIGNKGNKLVSLPAEVGFQGCKTSHTALNTVINARCDETLSMIKRRIEDENAMNHIGAGVILTGGGAHLDGIEDIAEKVFEMPCSIGKPRNVSGLATTTQGPEYAACCGLIQYGFKTSAKKENSSLIGKWLKDLLK